MSIPVGEVVRGSGMSPVTVNFERTARCDQTTVVMFETADGSAQEARHDYYAVKKEPFVHLWRISSANFFGHIIWRILYRRYNIGHIN